MKSDRTEYFREYREKNREKLSNYYKKWAQENPEKIRENQRRYRERVRNEKLRSES